MEERQPAHRPGHAQDAANGLAGIAADEVTGDHLPVAVPHHDPRMQPASRDQALNAVRAFHTERGRLPRWREWERATASRPGAKTIERRWGWRELMAEAIGIKPNEVDVSWEAVLDDRAQAMLTELRVARDELGRWPLAAEWDAAGRRPSSRTFARRFGSWAEACRAAGRAPL